MNNTEIRLRILFGCYAEMYHGQPADQYMESLKGVSETLINANKAYIIDKRLVDGVVDTFRAGLSTHIVRILPRGVDIVEEITSKSIDELEDPVAAEIRGSPDAQRAFWAKCVNVASACKIAVEVAGQVLATIG